MKKTVLIGIAVVALPALARAQEAAPQLEDDPRAAKFHDVERGFFAGFESGFMSIFSTPTADTKKFPFAKANGGLATGFAMGAHIGFDVTDRLSIALFGLGGNERASVSYGAFSVVSLGGDVRFALFVGKDASDIDRLFVYAHARAGYLVTRPAGLFGTSDVLVSGGPGIEYFTRLRHFSVGIAADFVFAMSAGAPGLAVLPTLRYTFQ